MMKKAPKYDPTRGEWQIRLAISVIGLWLLVAVVVIQGWPEGPGLVEVFGVAGLFFGASGLRALRGLLR